MREGPSKPPDRGRFQTIVSGWGPMAVVVSVTGTGGAGLRQVGMRELNTREPSMTCRKSVDAIKTGGGSFRREERGRNRCPGSAVAGIKTAGP